MKKRLLLTLLSCAITAPLWAQSPSASQSVPAAAAMQPSQGAGKITGTVVDSATAKPVEFATVALINSSTGKTVDGTVTDERGRFSLTKVSNGTYTLTLSFIGYDTKELKQITISSTDQEANLTRIFLSPSQTRLQEVTVTGEKPLIEDKVDRLVYNAEKDITNAGGTAADVMQKVPSISLDQDGNIQMRGSSNVRVLINGKPSTIMAGNVADALKQIPADIIKNVEVMTSPSAKYDAEGTAGIVNIVTKKNSLQGITGSVTVTGGTRASNGNANVGLKKGKFGVNVNAGTNIFYNKGDINLNQINYGASLNEVNSTSNQLGTNRTNGRFGFGQLGVDYDINAQNTLSAGIRMNTGQFKFKANQHVISTGTFPDEYDLSANNSNDRISMDLNLDYTHTFKKPQQELTLLALYSRTEQDNTINNDFFSLDKTPRLLQQNRNDGLNKELTFQADYAQPMPKNTLLEIGAKGILRDVASDARYRAENFLQNESSDSVTIFSYDQNVIAAYLSYGFNLSKKTQLKFGGRYEYTDVAGTFIDPKRNFTTNYDNFIPNLTLAYDLTASQKLRATFTQRIQRPQLFFLNPYRQQQGPNIVLYGNPKLDAELTDSYELNYSTFFKTTSLTVSAYMRVTDNAIEAVSNPEKAKAPSGEEVDITATTFANIAKNTTYGMSLSGSVKPVNAWNINGNVNMYYVTLKSPTVANSGLMYNINLSSGYSFGKGISAQFSGGFNAPRLALQGKFSSFSYHNLAIRKELFAKKGALSLGMDNPFREALTFDNNQYGREKGRLFDLNTEVIQYNRGFRLTFEYRFGKLQQQGPPKRKKSIRNDDVKQGDGAGQ